MIKKLAAASLGLIKYVCVASVIMQGALLLVLFLKGGLQPEKRLKIMAVLSGVDTAEIRSDVVEGIKAKDDLDAEAHTFIYATEPRREGIVRIEGVLDTTRIGLGRERQRYDVLRAEFGDALFDRERIAIEGSHEDLQRILESMDTKLAREQLVHMMDDNGLDDVVNILDAMPETKKRKILAEFRQPGDQDRLHELLMRLREQSQVGGTPDAEGGGVGP